MNRDQARTRKAWTPWQTSTRFLAENLTVFAMGSDISWAFDRRVATSSLTGRTGALKRNNLAWLQSGVDAPIE